MHGIWFLVFAPLAAVVAWRYSSVSLRRLAVYAMFLAAIFLVGWFGYHSIVGSEYATSPYDRAMHSMGVIIGSINVPIFQILLATVIVVVWPRKFEFGSQDPVVEPDAK